MSSETDVDLVFVPLRKLYKLMVNRKSIAYVARHGDDISLVWFDSAQKHFRRDEVIDLVSKRLGVK